MAKTEPLVSSPTKPAPSAAFTWRKLHASNCPDQNPYSPSNSSNVLDGSAITLYSETDHVSLIRPLASWSGPPTYLNYCNNFLTSLPWLLYSSQSDEFKIMSPQAHPFSAQNPAMANYHIQYKSLTMAKKDLHHLDPVTLLVSSNLPLSFHSNLCALLIIHQEFSHPMAFALADTSA